MSRQGPAKDGSLKALSRNWTVPIFAAVLANLVNGA